MNPLNLIPVAYKGWAYLGIAVAAMAAVYGYGEYRYSKGLEKGRSDVQSKWDAEKIKTKDVVINKMVENDKIEKTQDQLAVKVDHGTQDRLKVLETQLATERRNATSLRDTITTVRTNAKSEAATSASLIKSLSAATDVFEECQREYVKVAAETDRLAIQVTGLLELLPPIEVASEL